MKRTDLNIYLCILALAVWTSYLLYAPLPGDECSRIISRQDIDECYEKDIKKALERGGVSGGLTRLSELSQASPNFAGLCHNYAHSIGAYAYSQYAEGKSFTLSPAMSYCSYGFYHGFMEELIAQTGDYGQAAQFCTQFKGKGGLREKALDSECFHGIGHGITDRHIPSDWQNVESVVRRALSVCRAVAVPGHYFRDCAGGVYNAVANEYLFGVYGAVVDTADPLWLCKEAESSLQSDCYNYMARIFLKTGDGSFKQAIDQALTHTETSFRETVVTGLAVAATQRIKGDAPKALKICQTLNPSLQMACIGGLAMGSVQSGTPGKEHAVGISFCSQSSLNTNQSRDCFSRIAWDLKRLHTNNDLFRACVLYASLPSKRICINTLSN